MTHSLASPTSPNQAAVALTTTVAPQSGSTLVNNEHARKSLACSDTSPDVEEVEYEEKVMHRLKTQRTDSCPHRTFGSSGLTMANVSIERNQTGPSGH